VCGSPSRRSSACYSPEEAATHFCPETRDKDRYDRLLRCIRRLWANGECCIHNCISCGFGFGVPHVSGDEEFYEILHEQHGYPGWRWDYDFALEKGLGSLRGGRVLDVGAGTGLFLTRLSPGWSLNAVEGSRITRGLLISAGIRVFESLDDAAKQAPGSFQVVTLFQVLEHIAEFETTIQLCKALLVPEGIIVISVPEAGAMRRQEEITGCADMPPNHINRWTPASLSIALRTVGFTPGEVRFESASLRAVRGVIHTRILSDRKNETSLANRVYRVRSRIVRVVSLSLLAIPALLRLAPHLRTLCSHTAFAIVAKNGHSKPANSFAKGE
jgi:2-polyprenyl-3-methyl-5-hydroxy-6-metoxy-1,4-benzoquinol methylase